MQPFHRLPLVVALGLFVPASSIAQEFTFAQPFIQTCTGTLHDIGGPDAPFTYAQSYQTTICPGTEGSRIQLQFTTAQLGSTGGMRVFDGPALSTWNPPYYEGTELDGLTITASTDNLTGCITLVLNVAEAGSGDITALISCVTTCPAPVARFTTGADTARVCVGEPLPVSGAASTAAAGRTVERWIWITGQPMDTTATPDTTLSFATPGVHTVRLTVVDDEGCTGHSLPQVVLVASAATAAVAPVPPFVCVGTPIALHATPQLGAVPGARTCGDQLAPPITPLMDDVGPPFSSPITITGAAPGALIEEATQLGDICMDLEHSYMGDFFLTLTCPNGQHAVLHAQQGSGTYLGFPNDSVDLADTYVGTCATYCFSATPDFGTWVDCSIIGGTPNVVEVGGGQRMLIPGTYTPIGSLDALIGCPVNGTWTLQFTDVFAADNGNLCTWCVGGLLGHDTLPASTLPVLGPDPVQWSGPGVENDPAQPGTAAATPAAAGPHAYTFTLLDSYGCAYDTTVTVSAVEGLLLSLQQDPDGALCVSPPGLTYAWTFQGDPVTVEGECWTPPAAGLVLVQAVGLEACSKPGSYLATGVPQLHQAQGFSLYPVPTTGHFTVRATGLQGANATLRVRDLAGRVVYTATLPLAQGAAQAEVALVAAPGAYVVELTDRYGTHVRRTVVERP